MSSILCEHQVYKESSSGQGSPFIKKSAYRHATILLHTHACKSYVIFSISKKSMQSSKLPGRLKILMRFCHACCTGLSSDIWTICGEKRTGIFLCTQRRGRRVLRCLDIPQRRFQHLAGTTGVIAILYAVAERKSAARGIVMSRSYNTFPSCDSQHVASAPYAFLQPDKVGLSF